MEDIITYLKDHLTLAFIISIISLSILILGYRLNRRKFKLEKYNFESKKSKFSLYLENCYRFNYSIEEQKFLLFDIRITNHSSSNNSLLPKLRIVYYRDETNKTEIILEHDPTLFHETYHLELSKFDKEIRVSDKEIKSGWIIFKFPANLIRNKIDCYQISIEDGSDNRSQVTCNLLKEIDYEN